jgi:hypothetical protein
MSDEKARKDSLELHQFIGSLLTALVKAETMAAAETLKFLIGVGYEKEGENNLQGSKVRMVTFEYNQTDEQGLINTKTIQIPLLSLVTIPILKIDEAELDFEVEVKPKPRIKGILGNLDTENLGEKVNFKNLEAFLGQTSSPLVIVQPITETSVEGARRIEQKDEGESRADGEPDPLNWPWSDRKKKPDDKEKPDDKKNPEENQETMRLAVKVKVGRSDMPEGIRMLINLANNGVMQ